MKTWLAAIEGWRLRRKLWFGFTGMLLAILAIGVESYWSQRQLNLQIESLYNKQLVGIAETKSAQLQFAHIGRTIRMLVLAAAPEDEAVARSQLRQARAEFDRAIAATRQTLESPETLRHMADFEGHFRVYERNLDRTIALVDQGHVEQARRFVGQVAFQQAAVAAYDELDRIVRIKDQDAAERVAFVQDRARQSLRRTLFLLAFGLFAYFTLGGLIGRSINAPTERIRRSVDLLAHGELDHEIPHTQYRNEIGALARSVALLQSQSREQEDQRWIKVQLSELSAALQECENGPDLCRTLLERLAPLVNLGQGVFYRFDGSALHASATYACSGESRVKTVVALGEGLAGQCAKDRQPRLVDDLPADYPHISSGLGSAPPGRWGCGRSNATRSCWRCSSWPASRRGAIGKNRSSPSCCRSWR
ncbi:MCP four helix bundle domain-containing protein [Arenimonas daejeonensis]|uniref:MCP four helix bundle domain-containing protein n=1 Tax=Arenimonas daejeonensis TaxID=370777 RepID=UPI0011BD60BC|nr:MCP four helix bundle domain-containing protein [Arenimonas daejeonensis]